MSEMYRKRKDRGYTMIDNHSILNPNLSWKAKGILLYLMSRPDDWIIYQADLIKRSKDQRSSVEGGLEELEKEGYLISFQYRNDKGQFKTFYYYDDVPLDKNDPELKALIEKFTAVENQQRSTDAEKPQRKNRNGKTAAENQQLLITKELITDELNTDNTNNNNIYNKGELNAQEILYDWLEEDAKNWRKKKEYDPLE